MKSGLFKHLLALALVYGALGCGGRRMVKLDGANVSGKGGVASMRVGWIKDKGKKFDFELTIESQSNESIIVMLPDVHCYRGKTRGVVRHTFFNTGERTIDLLPGEQKTFNALCHLGSESSGPFKISIERIYLNSANDGMTRGKQLGGRLEWSISDAEGK